MLVESKTPTTTTTTTTNDGHHQSVVKQLECSTLLGPPRTDTRSSLTTTSTRRNTGDDAVIIDNAGLNPAAAALLKSNASHHLRNDNQQYANSVKELAESLAAIDATDALAATTTTTLTAATHAATTESSSSPLAVATTASTAENSSSLELMTVLLKDNDIPSVQVQSVSGENGDEESDNESVISDYSEIGDAFKEHLTTSFSEGELKLIAKHDLTSADFRFDASSTTSKDSTSTTGADAKHRFIPGIETRSTEEDGGGSDDDDPRKQLEEESDLSYAKRMKKINYLSLAQEFAQLKKMDANALPFGLTRTDTLTGVSDGEDEGDDRSASILEGTLSDEEDTEEKNSTCDDMNSYTESAQPTPMDISQENVEADSLSCPESDSLLLPSSNASFSRAAPIDVEDLPRDAEDAASSSTALQPEVVVDQELEALSIDVVEAWRIVAPPPPPPPPPPPASKSDAVKSGGKWIGPDEGGGGRREVGEGKDKSEVVSPSSESGAFEVYSAESLAPPSMSGMDWSSLERKLEQAAEEEARRKASSGSKANDREEIRRRLAMGDAEDDAAADYYCGERVKRKPNLATRLKSNMNLQICFMNEETETIEIDGSTAGGDVDYDGGDALSAPARRHAASDDLDSTLTPSATLVPQQPATDDGSNGVSNSAPEDSAAASSAGASLMKNSKSVGHFLHCLLPGSKQPQVKVTEPPEPDEDFETRQTRLRAEAQKALAQAQPMAHMQIEIEKMSRKKSPMEEIMSFHGINVADPSRKLTKTVMERDMNLAQLQVIFNDLRTQVDNYSQELVRLLEERDDLHMEQDSMLVDIDDLTRRLKDMAEKSKKPARVKEGAARGQRKTPLKQFNDWLQRK